MLNALLPTPPEPEAEGNAPQVVLREATGARTCISVTTRDSVREGIQNAADALGVAPHQVSIYALQFFLAHYEAGTSGVEKFYEPPKPRRGRIRVGAEQ